MKKKLNGHFLFPKEKWLKSYWLMRNFIVLFFVLNISVMANGLSQEVSMAQYNNATLVEVFKHLMEETGYGILYKKSEINPDVRVSLDVENSSVQEILDEVLLGTKLSYVVRDEVIVIYHEVKKAESIIESAQEKKEIKGKVTDENGDPIPGVNIILVEYNIGTVTNVNGNYKISVPVKKVHLSFSFIGFEKQTVVVDGRTEINVQLKTEVNELGGVVVTGIFNKARESFTGAATFITKEKLQEFENRDILKTISSIDPSFNIAVNDEFGSDPNRLPEINIRGTSSLPSKSDEDLTGLQDNERTNLNTPLFIMDGFEISLQRMMDLNQEEIESITILKDASATAIYGAQGANGVVVLTTVKPKAGKLKVSYRASFDLEVPDLRSYNLLNASEKFEVENLAGLYNSDDFNTQLLLKGSYNKKLKTIKEGTDTYWLSKPVQVGVGQTHSLGLSGGDSAFRYSLNFSYRNVKGAMKGSARDNLNGSVNITYLLNKFKFTNILSLGFNNEENSQYGSFSQYASLNPYWRSYNEDGEIPSQLGLGDPMLTPVYNPLYDASLGGYDLRKYTNIRENLKIEWSVNDNLRISGALGYTRNLGGSDKFLPPNHTTFIGVADHDLRGSYNYGNSESSTINGQTTISFAKVIDKHRFFLGINSRLRQTKSVRYGVNVTGYAHDRMDFISMGSKYRGDSPSGYEATSRSIGFTLNGNYSFNNCYFADVSYRLDGASSFGENSRFAPFYSIGLGWNIHRTKFVKDNAPVFSNLRLKYSYGVTGSLQFSPYDAMTTYNYMTTQDRYDGNLATSIRKLGNPDLQWQTTYQHNVGCDISLWKNAVSINGNYYYKRTEDLITTVSLPLSNGYTNYTENMGDVLNQGIEVSVSVGILRNHPSGLRWSVSGAIMHNRNKLLTLSDAMKKISSINEQNAINKKETEPNFLYREGESMNALFVVPSLGIDPMTGREMFVNKQGEVTYDYPQFNRIPYGLLQPKVNGRFSSNWTYKNLRLNIGFSFRLGASVYNSTLASKVEVTDLSRNVDQRVLDDRWQKPGDISKYKGLDNDDPTYMSSRFVQTERTLQLNSLSLDYQVPRKWVKKNLKMERANISYSTNDLLYISTIKKERGTGYPYALRHSISLSLGF